MIDLIVMMEAAPIPRNFGQLPSHDGLADWALGLTGLAIACLLALAVMRLVRALTFEPSPGFVGPYPAAMSPAFRRKLRQWLASVATIITASVLMLCAAWFIAVPSHPAQVDQLQFADLIWLGLAEGLNFYALALLPTLLWHLSDLIERGPPRRPLLRFLTGYSLLASLLVVIGTAAVLLSTGKFNIETSCGGGFPLLFQACVGKAPIVGLPTNLSIIALPLLTLLKLAVALHSRLGRQR